MSKHPGYLYYVLYRDPSRANQPWQRPVTLTLYDSPFHAMSRGPAAELKRRDPDVRLRIMVRHPLSNVPDFRY